MNLTENKLNYLISLNYRGMTNEIYENRKDFMIENKIKRYVRDRPKYIEKEFDILGNDADHIECYMTEDNRTYILLIHPYKRELEEKNRDYGWVKINKLYKDSATSFMKKIIKHSVLKREMRL